MKIFGFDIKKASEDDKNMVVDNVVNYVSSEVSQVADDVFLKLLTLFERANHYVKEGDWYENDKRELYALKDRFLTAVYRNPVEGAKINLLYVPYYRYCNETKDKAGAMMRADGNKQPFEYYLSQIQPTSNDIEVPGKATLEMLIEYKGRVWCFHIPEHLTSDWGVDTSKLKRKVWMNGRDFHAQQFQLIKKEAEELLSQL